MKIRDQPLYLREWIHAVPAPNFKVAEMREAECSSLARRLTTVTTTDPARCVDVSEPGLLLSSTRLRLEHLRRIGQRFHLPHNPSREPRARKPLGRNCFAGSLRLHRT